MVQMYVTLPPEPVLTEAELKEREERIKYGNAICVCGHRRSSHIYNRADCRSGDCYCMEFKEVV